MFGNEAIFGTNIITDIPIDTWELTLIPNKEVHLQPVTYKAEYSVDGGSWVEVSGNSVTIIQTGSSSTIIIRALRETDIIFNQSTGIQHAKILYGAYIMRFSDTFNSTEGLESLTIASGQNVDHIDSLAGMFSGSDITDSFTTNVDFSNAKFCHSMFTRCNGITQTVSSSLFDFSSIIFASSMYRSCDNLVTINSMPLPLAKDVSALFMDCASLLHIPNMSFPEATSLNRLCGDDGGNAHVLQTVGNISAPKGETFFGMFQSQPNLTSIGSLDLSHAEKIEFMLYKCTALTSINIISPLGPTITKASFAFGETNLSMDLEIDLSNNTTFQGVFDTSKFTKLTIGNVVMTESNLVTFFGMPALTDICGSIDTTGATSLGNLFGGNTVLNHPTSAEITTLEGGGTYSYTCP